MSTVFHQYRDNRRVIVAGPITTSPSSVVYSKHHSIAMMDTKLG